MLLLLLQIPCTPRAMFWGQITQVPSCQGTGKGGGTVSLGGRVLPRWQTILGWVSQMGCGGSALPLILQRMLMHAAEEGQKEAERFLWWDYWHTLPRLNPEVDVPAVQIVGYLTSQKEIWDLYHKVYLLRRLAGPLPCGSSQMEGAIQDILSSIRNYLHRQEGNAMLEESQRGATVAALCPSHHMRSHSQSQGRDYQHDKAPWDVREAHWWVLEAVHMLELNIDRLSQEVDSVQCWWPHSWSCSCSHHWVGLWIGMRGPWANIDGRDMWPFWNQRRGCPWLRDPTKSPKGVWPEPN